MQRHTKISLNAIRVFMIVARHQSIARAANELGVTPSAVSHQIKNLEMMLATPLFVLGNNAIALTSTGRHFLDEVLPGLRVIEQAVDNLVRDANEITVRVSATLAVRWLIPALDGFKEQCPEARIRIETSLLDGDQLGHRLIWQSSIVVFARVKGVATMRYKVKNSLPIFPVPFWHRSY